LLFIRVAVRVAAATLVSFLKSPESPPRLNNLVFLWIDASYPTSQSRWRPNATFNRSVSCFIQSGIWCHASDLVMSYCTDNRNLFDFSPHDMSYGQRHRLLPRIWCQVSDSIMSYCNLPQCDRFVDTGYKWSRFLCSTGDSVLIKRRKKRIMNESTIIVKKKEEFNNERFYDYRSETEERINKWFDDDRSNEQEERNK